MSDEEFEDCIDLIIQSGRVEEAIWELQVYLDGLDALDDSDILSGEQEDG